MSRIPNSIHGEVRFQGAKVAKITGVNIPTQRATLPTGGIGDVDEEYCYGGRSTSGSATLLYKMDDPATVALMNRIFDDNEQPDELEMVIHKGAGKTISGPALISSQDLGHSQGALFSVSITFVISGKPSRAF